MFGRESVNITEGNTGTMCVVIDGELEREISVNVSFADDAALAEVNFDSNSITLTFSSTLSDPMCFLIDTLADDMYEENEQFYLNLDSSDEQAVFGAIDMTLVIIEDNNTRM